MVRRERRRLQTLREEVQDEGDRVASRLAAAGLATQVVFRNVLTQDSSPCGQRLLRSAATNFKAVWKDVQRIWFRRFCMVPCSYSGPHG
ncbi:hypothetical protein MRX96_031697 [Rhipicephalus microplus]